MEAGIYQREVFLSYDSIIHNARNDILRLAIEHDFDDLIYIDGDQEWQPEWVLKLLAFPVDVVGGAVRKKTDDAELYNVKHPDADIPVDPQTGLLMPEALGTGFLRLSKKAMRALWDASDPYQVLGAPLSRWVFDIRPVDGLLQGEDVWLCRKLRALGFQIHLDQTITCGHIGAKKFNGNFANWLERAKAAKPKAAKPKEEVPVQKVEERQLPEGLWLLPSRNRIAMLDRFFQAAIKARTNTRGVVLVQEDELKANLAEYEKLVKPEGWWIQATAADGMVAKIHEAEPLYMGLQWTGILCDDHVPETWFWDRMLVTAAKQTGKLVYCDDGSNQRADRICGGVVIPIGLVRAMGGHIFPLGFNHLCTDDVLEALNLETGFAVRVAGVMVRHLHPWVTGVFDETHKKAYSEENQKHDIEALKRWAAEEKPKAVEAVKKYLSTRP